MTLIALTLTALCVLVIPCHGTTTQGPYDPMVTPSLGVTDRPNQQGGNNYHRGDPGYPPRGQTYNRGEPGSPPDGNNYNRGEPGSPPDGNNYNRGEPGSPPDGNNYNRGEPGSPPDGNNYNRGEPDSPPDGNNYNRGEPGSPPDGNNYNRGEPDGPPDSPDRRNNHRNQQGNPGHTRRRPGNPNGPEGAPNYGRPVPQVFAGNSFNNRPPPGNQRGPELVPNYGRFEPQVDNAIDPRRRPGSQSGPELVPNYGQPVPQGRNSLEPGPRAGNQNGPELVPNYGQSMPDSNRIPNTPFRGAPEFMRSGEQEVRPRSGTRLPDGYPGSPPDGFPFRNERPDYRPYDRNQPDYGYRYQQHRYNVNGPDEEYNRRVPGRMYVPGSRSGYGVPPGQYQRAYQFPPAQPRRSTYDYRYYSQYTSPVVAFSATSKSSQTFYTAGDVVFNNVITNVGGGYNYRYSVFTAPVDGIYIVTYHASSQPLSKKPAMLNLLRNGRIVNSARAHGVSGMASNSAILYLNRYDRLSVQGRAGTAIFCESGQAFCSFNVGLLNIGKYPHSTYPY